MMHALQFVCKECDGATYQTFTYFHTDALNAKAAGKSLAEIDQDDLESQIKGLTDRGIIKCSKGHATSATREALILSEPVAPRL
jgi:hypothetical protein